MRYLSCALTTLALTACTRLNPAFGEGSSDTSAADSAADSLTDSGPTSGSGVSTATSAESSTSVDSGSTSVDSGTSDTSSTQDTGETDLPLECSFPQHDLLRFKLLGEVGAQCLPQVSIAVEVTGPGANGSVMGNPCEPGCGACDLSQTVELEAYPLDLNPGAGALAGSCVQAGFDFLVGPTAGGCEYQQLVISTEGDPGPPFFVGSSIDEFVPAMAQPTIPRLPFGIVEDILCECDPGDSCCDPLDAPGTYGFAFDNSTPLYPGESDVFYYETIGYKFDAVAAHRVPGCGKDLTLSWAFTQLIGN